MNIGIIDAEIIGKNKHRFPNLVCMKTSAYYKELGHNVELCLSYDDIDKYDKVFISKVFIKTDIPCEPDNKNKNEQNVVEYYSTNEFLKNPKIEYGGTGFYYEKSPRLSYEIEHHMPDYHLYDEWVSQCVTGGAKAKEFVYYTDYSIGFLTRGCFRQCQFCVNKVYNRCEPHSNLHEFMDESRPKLCFLDDNFFACPQWKEIIQEVKATKKKFQFKQGLDERLLTDEKVQELVSWRYDGDYIFAFDNIADKDLIIRKAELIRKYYQHHGNNIKFYVFCGFDRNNNYDEAFFKQDLIDVFERIFILAKYNFKPYIMRHENYKLSPYYGTYINLARWCNQASLFTNHSYRGLTEKDDARHKHHHICASWQYMKKLENDYPDIAEKYFDIIPKELVDCYKD